MDLSDLHETLARIESDPRSGASLTLYGLLKTLSDPRGMAMFSLGKLSELDAEDRRRAYSLMELAARGAGSEREWRAAVERLDDSIRGGSGN